MSAEANAENEKKFIDTVRTVGVDDNGDLLAMTDKDQVQELVELGFFTWLNTNGENLQQIKRGLRN